MDSLVENSFKYRNWRRRLEKSRVEITSVENPYTHTGNDGQMLYALLNPKLKAADGREFGQLLFLRGDSVSMLVVLIEEESGEKSVLLVRQRRLVDGSETYEHPAGMIDEGETPVEVAARELKEEAGLDVSEADLIPLFDRPLSSMSSNSDECLYFFSFERRMKGEAIRALHGRRMGKESENEQTRLEVHSFEDAHRRISNIHGILAHFLYLAQVGDYEQIQKLKG